MSFIARLAGAIFVFALFPFAVGFLELSLGTVIVGWLGPPFVFGLVITAIALIIRGWRIERVGPLLALLVPLAFAGLVMSNIYVRRAGTYAAGALKLHSTQDRYETLLARARAGALTGADSFSPGDSKATPAKPGYRIVSESPLRAEFDSNHDLVRHQLIYYDPAFFAAHPGIFTGEPRPSAASTQSDASGGPWGSSTKRKEPLDCIALWDGYGICRFPASD